MSSTHTSVQGEPPQPDVPVEETPKMQRQRTLTEKGLTLQIETKTKLCTAKRAELTKQRRKIMSMKGECSELAIWKKEYGLAQIMFDEYSEMTEELSMLVKDRDEAESLGQKHDRVKEEWNNFEQDVRKEIEYLQHVEELLVENMSATSGGSGSRRSDKKPGSSSRSHTNNSVTSSRQEKIMLRKEEATLRAKLAFAKEKQRLMIEQLEEERRRLDAEKASQIARLDREERLEQLQLKEEIAEKRAQLEVFQEIEKEELGLSEQDLSSVPPANKQEDLKKFFESQECSPPLIDSPFAAQATPTFNEVPVFPHSSPERAPEVDISSHVPVPDDARAQSSFTRDSSHDDVQNGWDRVACSLEKCVSLLAEENKQQRTVSHKIAVSSQLPKITIPVFTGDPLQFPMWQNSFNALVDMKPLDVDTKMNYLNQYVSGRPKQVVEHYLLIGTEDAYLKARYLLSQRYGNSSVIGTAFLNKLEKWPRIVPRDAASLREFSDFLGKIMAARKTVPSLGVLDYAKENAKLVEKIPQYLDSKWRDVIEKWKLSHGEGSYPPFSEFVEFIRKASDKANMPELESLSKARENQRPSGHGTSSSSSYHSKKNAVQYAFATTTGRNQTQKMDGKENVTCLNCKKPHSLDECLAFMKKPFTDRKQFFFRLRLCMGCGVSTGHQVKDCSSKKTCRTCGGAHLTCLHRSKPIEEPKPSTSTATSILSVPKEVVSVHAQPEKGTSNCTSVCSHPDQNGEGDLSMIVPVLVRSKSDPSRESLEYAVLDDQSNSCFVTESLCKKLDLEGTKTQLLLTTMQERNACIMSKRVSGIEVLDVNREHVVRLPVCYSREVVPARQSQIPKPDVVKKWSHLEQIAEKMMSYDPNREISLLIGSNCPSVVRPREIVAAGEDEPYGQRSLLGWGVIGRVCKSPADDKVCICNKMVANEAYPHFVYGTKAKEVFNAERVLQVLESDFSQTSAKGKPFSAEDSRFISVLETGIEKRPDGHYEMPLPLKSNVISLPYNRELAVKRWNQLKARFKKNPKFLEDYREFMSEVIADCAERVPVDRLHVQDGKVNYVPHTGVYHPKKPGKIRVVFDCSAQYGGVSLNDQLLQGPDMINGLLGVLCRFREEEVAFMMDIKGMFHQFHVSEENRDLLRFLWWENGDPTKDVIDYRMTVHLFGAASSPGCAIFGLRRAADDGEERYGTPAANFIRRDFYVDDGLKSVPTVTEAVDLIKASQCICARAGLKLHKVTSNKKAVIEAVPPDDRAKGLKELDLKIDPLPIERALGVTWCIESDTFQFRIELRDRPFTRRGILSTVGSIYDPNGYVAPVTLKGKQILQQMCRDKLDWDSPISESLRPKWEKWRSECMHLEQLQIKRCYKPDNFGCVKLVELHHFSDASEEGYGQCSYLRLVNERNEAHCSFVMGKARVTPLKHVTIPRLELAAATISVRTSEFLRAELSYESITEFFWTDSKIVLGYVSNDARRFHVYVANRVQQIRDSSDPSSWHYVETSCNPADEASRGLTANQLVEKSCWLAGPAFLRQDGPTQINQMAAPKLDETDPEVRRVAVLSTRTKTANNQFPDHFEKSRLDRFSTWHRAKRAIATCLRYKARLRRSKVDGEYKAPVVELHRQCISVQEMEEAETEILRSVQRQHFKNEVQALLQLRKTGEFTNREAVRIRNQTIKKSSSLYRLDPFLDEKDVLRVGGRIQRARVPTKIKHPAILPRKDHITELVVRHYHEKVHHMGRGITHNEIRQGGYWVIGGSSAVSNYISRCVTCRRLRGSLLQQKMADLPEDRLEPAPPFSYCAVDYFGPFLVRERRSQVKRYGVLFTCMASRAVHLETANSLTAGSFISALRRFQSRRGPVRLLRSDQGTTFIGARNELREALAEMEQDRVQQYLSESNCDWIPFKLNTPHASHMGGAWERQIGTVRRILEGLLLQTTTRLDDECFRTFMTEVEGIINSRPLTTDHLCSSDAPEPLTPSHLLTMKPKVVLPPPGKFQKEDSYARKWWRHVQYLTNEFWVRWRKEFLHHLQRRKKWIEPERNLQVGDVVIAKEGEETRNHWPLGRIVEIHPSRDGRVRSVKLLMADSSRDNLGKRRHAPSLLDRPVHKLVLLVPTEMPGPQETEEVPTDEPN